MNVLNRIKQYPARKAIDLASEECQFYHGCGWALARFENGKLAGTFYPHDCEISFDEPTQIKIDKTTEDATAWLANAQGEVWFGMMSCHQLCEPRRVALTGEFAMNLPWMLNRIAEEVLEDENEE